MCSLGNGNCFFCQLIKAGLDLNAKALDYRATIRKLNEYIGGGIIKVGQVDAVPVISVPSGLGFGFTYEGLMQLALATENSYQFLKGSEAIMIHDPSSFSYNVDNIVIRTFFIAQLFSETARGHLSSVLGMLSEMQNYAVGPVLVMFGGMDDSKRNEFGKFVRSENEGLVKIVSKFRNMQKGGGWPTEQYKSFTTTVTPNILYKYGVVLKNKADDIKLDCVKIKSFLSKLGNFTIDIGDLAPLVYYNGIPRKYTTLIQASLTNVKSALNNTDTVISDGKTLELLAAAFVPEIVRGYKSQVDLWVQNVKTTQLTTVPTSSFMN